MPILTKSSLRPSRLVRKQDPSNGLSDYSKLLHFTGGEEWLLRGRAAGHSINDIGLTAFRMAIRFGLPESIALLFQDFGFVDGWDPWREPGTRSRGIVTIDEIDANLEQFEKRNWTELQILMMKAFVWRSENPFSRNLEEMSPNPGYAIYSQRATTPYVEYEKTIHAIIALIPQGKATAADVALVLKWAPMFAEYADKAGPYATGSFKRTVQIALELVKKLNNEAMLAGRTPLINLPTLNMPGFLNTIGTAKAFEFDETLIKKLKRNAILKDALVDLRIPRLSKTLRTIGRTSWRKFIRSQSLWNELHLDVFRGMTPAESLASMKTGYPGFPDPYKSPFFHAAVLSSRLATSESFALLFNPYAGGSSPKKRKAYVRPTNVTIWLLGELVKSQMRSKFHEVVFGEDSPEALAYQFNKRKPIQDPAAAFAQILIDSPLAWGNAMLSDLVGMVDPEILFEAVEQCFIHPKNEVWDERERKQIFGRTAQLLGKVALASPRNGIRAIELLSKLRFALPDETLLAPQKRRIVQQQVKHALMGIELPESLSPIQLVDILTEHWMDVPARKQALMDLNVDEMLADDLAPIGSVLQPLPLGE